MQLKIFSSADDEVIDSDLEDEDSDDDDDQNNCTPKEDSIYKNDPHVITEFQLSRFDKLRID